MNRVLRGALCALASPLALLASHAIAEEPSIQLVGEPVARCLGDNAEITLRLRNRSGEPIRVRGSAAIVVQCTPEDEDQRNGPRRRESVEAAEAIPDNRGRPVLYKLVLEGQNGCNSEERVAAVEFGSFSLEIDGEQTSLRVEGCGGGRD